MMSLSAVGRIFKALTLGADVPSTNTAALRSGARSANDRDPLRPRAAAKRLHVLTGNGNRRKARRADAAEAGVSRVTVLKMTPKRKRARPCGASCPAMRVSRRATKGSSGAGSVRTNRGRMTERYRP